MSITTVIQNTVKYAKHRRTLSFQVRTVLLTSWLRPIATREEGHNSYNADTTNTRRILWCPRSLSVEIRKTQLHASTVENSILYAPMAETQLPPWSNFNSQLTLFQNLQVLRTISSGHDFIHTPVPFSVWGFIMTMVIVISFARKRKLHQLGVHLGS